MSRVKEDKSEATKARNAAAMRRLEELLRDPGPGIVVRRVDAAGQFARIGEPLPRGSEILESVAPAVPAPPPVATSPSAPVTVAQLAVPAAAAAPTPAAGVPPPASAPAAASVTPVAPARGVIKTESVAPEAVVAPPKSHVPSSRIATATVDRIARKKNFAEPISAPPVTVAPELVASDSIAATPPAPKSVVEAAPAVEPSINDKAPEPAAETIASDLQPATVSAAPAVEAVDGTEGPPAAMQDGLTLTVAAVQITPTVPAHPQEVATVKNAAAFSISVSQGLAVEADSRVEPAAQTPRIEAASALVGTTAEISNQETPDDARVAVEVCVPAGSSQQPIRERLQRAARIQAADASLAKTVVTASVAVAAPAAPAAQVMAVTPAPTPIAQQPPVASSVKIAVEPAPASAAPRVAPAQAPKAQNGVARSDTPMAEHLKHMPAGVRGRLASYLEGKLSAAPAAAPEAKVAAPEGVTSRAMGRPGDGELRTALLASRKPFLAAGLFSFVINILMLAGPLFMLQVYDRVLGSGSIATLVALTVLTSAMYGIIALLELSRTRIIVRMGTEIDQRVSDRIFRASLRKTLSNPTASIPALRELDNVRQFAGSQGPLTFFDAPWTPIYLGVIAMVHWALGLTAVIGAASLMVITWLSEKRSRGPLTEAGKAMNRSIELAETGQRNAESLTAMGMIGAYRDRWQEVNWDSLSWQMQAADRLGSMAAFSKGLRLFLQSLMLAIGAGLAVKGEISAGSIIAGTIIFGRALAPIEQAISHWKGYLKACESYAKLDKLLRTEPEPPQRLALPAPRGRLEVDSLRVAAPDTQHLILTSVNFRIDPGQMLAVIGPSASGKSTLARTLVGLWQPVAGSIRLDGARLEQWDPEALGAHIGFLPQNVELFAGSVRDNIARFQRDATDDEVTEAARAAHAHDLILALPQGYETPLGAFGTYLSSGQRQRIALSRALFRHPALVVLDEPNSNLDRDGDEALAAAIDGMRKRGQAVILVSHRVQAIGKADLLLYLERGAQRAFGPRREVMKLFQPGGEGAAVKAQPVSKAGSA